MCKSKIQGARQRLKYAECHMRNARRLMRYAPSKLGRSIGFQSYMREKDVNIPAIKNEILQLQQLF